MKNRILGLLLLGFVTSYSCTVRHVDFGATFIVQGQVVDESTAIPIVNAKAFFLDTGLDHVYSSSVNPIEIGTSDSNGRIHISFDYWWGAKEGFFIKRTKNTFCIKLTKDGYMQRIFEYKLSDFDETGDIVIDVGKVSLNRR